VQRTNHDRVDSYVDLVREVFASSCTCDECSVGHNISPRLLCVATHEPDELVVQPRCRLTLVSNCDHEAYNAMKLAWSTIVYFSRSEDAMHPVQRQHMNLVKWQFESNAITEALGTPHPRTLLSEDRLEHYADWFNEIF
jgi:hypothetical protein